MLTDNWKEKLNQKLQLSGARKSAALIKKYQNAFDVTYMEECSVEQALRDIEFAEKISEANSIELDFYFKADKVLHLRLYKYDKLIPLSDILPILSDFDFRILSERTFNIAIDGHNIWISDFVVCCARPDEFQVDLMRQLYRDAFIEICAGRFESDGFNKLILGAQLSWREIMILRAYAKYLRQAEFRFSQLYLEQALVHNASIAKNLIALFFARHDPKKAAAKKNLAQEEEDSVLKALDQVTSLDEDLIIRRLLALIKATLRTNYFQLDKNNAYKSYLAFKFKSEAIPELPLPVPLYEIFIYSCRFEGIHLRSAKVARGGIRWSDRREDFRREVLGLMKAQKVKNAIIVPSGAKGGFVLKAVPPSASSEMIKKEVVECYQLFIRGLLDLTDNIVARKVLHPKDVVCLDEPDSYLVVAADKGTATFSDIANGIAIEYGFWLGDAFASGGKTGYDHKKIGITARGAWESVKRHFRSLDINIDENVITTVGIGDMSGDVFGNGLIYSKNIKLLAAFDHRHIFLDPNPDPNLSYQERLRLFKLPTSSWEDYNSALISRGGGVYKRSAKSVTITPEVKKILGIVEDSLMPNELVRAILKAPVDLLWNGGIGTYVKASYESNADVGDKTNDLNRVNGNELRCQVVGEGGNLGFTQNARVEYALAGGLINTDFIDNSAGVDCSDHEVNLKILLNNEIAKKKLTEKKRNQLLAQVTPEIAHLVLRDNYNQAWVLGYLAQYAYNDMTFYQGYIKDLESAKLLNRRVEFLPDDKAVLERKTAGLGLTRPELAILLAYTKIHIKNEILKSDLPEEPFFAQMMESAFPNTINKSFNKSSHEHILRREIIATQLSSALVNEMGIIFVYRMQNEAGAIIPEIVRAHAVASAVFGSQKMQKTIESLDFKIPVTVQYELLFHMRHLINISTRWFLRENRLEGNISKIIEHYSSRVKMLEATILDLMTGVTKIYLEALTQQFLKSGLAPDLASHIASFRVAYTALNIIEVATAHNLDLMKTAHCYFNVGESFNLVWFRDHIANDVREGSWNMMARLTLRDELDVLQKGLTVEIIKANKREEDVAKAIASWKSKNSIVLERWEKMLTTLHESTTIEYTMFFIALNELKKVLQR
jgi:glutamate dehydrogenase